MLSVHGIPASIRNVRSVLPAAICHFGSRCPLPARGRVAEGREGAVALWCYRTITISPSPSVRWGRVAERSKAGRGPPQIQLDPGVGGAGTAQRGEHRA